MEPIAAGNARRRTGHRRLEAGQFALVLRAVTAKRALARVLLSCRHAYNVRTQAARRKPDATLIQDVACN